MDAELNIPNIEPQAQHHWLQRMVGRWTAEHECQMGPDGPTWKGKSTEIVRSLGGLWVIAEGEGETPDGGPSHTIMSLGYDPQKGKFVGSFVASMMANLWIYEGLLDEKGQKLTLNTDGPDFSGGAHLRQYSDVIEFLDDNHRTLTSYSLGDDGTPQQFMAVNYHRQV